MFRVVIKLFLALKNVVSEIKNFQGIFSHCSAAIYYSWGTNVPHGFSLLTANLKPHTYKMLGIVTFHGTDDLVNNLIQLPSGNFVTNEDRTILEQMDYFPIDEFTSQEMEDYGIDEKLEHLIKFNDKYNYCTKENFDLALKCYYEWCEDPH